MKNGSYVRCVFHVLKSTPPLPTQPLVSATRSARMPMASGSITTTPAAQAKGDSTPKNHIGSIKKWCVRRRGSSSTASEVTGTFLHFRFLSSHFITHRSIQPPNRSGRMLPTAPCVQKPPCRLLHANRQHRRYIPQVRLVLL